MKKYAALLRGVNVGGHRRVPKDEFKAVLESLGFTDVVIYINSGNAVFASDFEPSSQLVQTALEDHFGFDIATLVIAGDDILRIAGEIPEHWTTEPPTPEKTGYLSNVIYLFDEIDSPDALERLKHDPDVEDMIYLPGAILQRVSRANQTKSALQKTIGKQLYQQMTVRNINTARKLAELVS